MYTLAVGREFEARHFLVGGDWGEENRPHAHQYRVEAQISGERLNEHGYLADLVDFGAMLDQEVAKYNDSLLNSLSDFSGQNPSIELLAKTFADSLAGAFQGKGQVCAVRVKVWENRIAWASYQVNF